MPRSARTQRRDKQRTPEEVELLELARELDWLARRYARFADPLNKLMVRVRWQLRPHTAKQAAIREVLSNSRLGIEEIMEETDLDKHSVTTELAAMAKAGTVHACDREGNALVVRSNGRPTRTPLYRLATPLATRATPRATMTRVGPSQTSVRRG